MARNQSGFSMIELIIAMALFVVVIVSATNVFTPLLSASKQQSSISETYIEGVIGLDIMRRDIEHAGIGLAWDLDGAAYAEAVDVNTINTHNESSFNDANNPPRKIVDGNGAGAGGSDVIVIKSVLAATNEASQKWTHVNSANVNQDWDPAHERFQLNDRVIVIVPGVNRKLVRTSGGVWTTTYDSVAPLELADDDFLPTDPDRHYIVYGINTATGSALRMPFNRADFYVSSTSATFPPPLRCAQGTRVLFKGTVSHNGGVLNELPLLDCVADIQFAYGYDNDQDEDTPIVFVNDLTGILTTAEEYRRIKQVRVYVLAQEGQRDPNFTFTNFTCGANCVTVGESAGPAAGEGRNFNFVTQIGTAAATNWDEYRWKLYILVIDITG